MVSADLLLRSMDGPPQNMAAPLILRTKVMLSSRRRSRRLRPRWRC
nr:MAG TPA: hypothetical protein [Caudoviricetes sp.]